MLHASKIIRGLLDKHNRIIYGDKGTGKTFTLLLYSYLSSFIIEYKMQRKERKLEVSPIYKNILDGGCFNQVNKMFYVPLKSIFNENNLL